MPKLENSEVKIEPKKFVAVPRDAFECLARRHGSMADAIAEGETMCAEDGMTVYVLELKAVVSRADRPVTVKKL